MSSGRFDAVFVDFYGTISSGDREIVESSCQDIISALDLPMRSAELAIQWGERFFALIERSNHDAFQTLYECEIQSLKETLAPHVGDVAPLPYVAMLERYWANPPIHDDAIGFLERIGLPTCCVSNADTNPLLAAIAKHSLRFDHVVTSEEARCYKPDPAIFQLALEKAGSDPKRTLHVGDSLHSDVGGAAKLGITTVWLCRDDRIHDIGTNTADYRITSLADLPTMLD